MMNPKRILRLINYTCRNVCVEPKTKTHGCHGNLDMECKIVFSVRFLEASQVISGVKKLKQNFPNDVVVFDKIVTQWYDLTLYK